VAGEDRHQAEHRDGFPRPNVRVMRSIKRQRRQTPSAWRNSLGIGLRLLNDFFELRFSTFVISPTLKHTDVARREHGNGGAPENAGPPQIF
jgi:hypothetical protein